MKSQSKQRILIALDSLEANEESLIMLTSLAGRLKASLSGLFIEDSRLSEAAGLSFTTEINRISAQERTFHSDTLARLNKTMSANIQHLLEELAKRHKISCSFNREPGELISKALSQDGFDVFFPARRRHQLKPARSVSHHAAPIKCTLIYDVSPQFQRAMDMLRMLASDGLVSDITILCNTDLPQTVTAQLVIRGSRLHILTIPSSYPELLKALPLESSTLTLLSKQSISSLTADELSALLSDITTPLLLLD